MFYCPVEESSFVSSSVNLFPNAFSGKLYNPFFKMPFEPPYRFLYYLVNNLWHIFIVY